MNAVEEYSLMLDFLSAFDPMVEPRGEDKSLSTTQRKLLERIARGEASATERDSALPVLLKHPQALEFLAQQLNEVNP
jgi:hypothetical protein